MPFIGNQPALSYTSFAKQDFTTSATTSYTLSQPVANENEIALFINFVRQEPTTAYTASGTSLTLTSATSASDDMYAIFLGKAVQTVNPPAGSVGISQLSATGTKNSTTFLRGDNTFNTPPLGGITMVDQWRLTTSFTNDAYPISSNLERVDTDGFDKIGTGMSESSGIFSFPSTGVYLIIYQWYGTASVAQVYGTSAIEVTLNNSTYNAASFGEVSFYGANTYSSSVCSHIVNVNDISNIKVRFTVDAVSANTSTSGNTGITLTGFTFIRLGDAV